MAREPFEKTNILLKIETCKECPHVKSHRNIHAGFAYDYNCTHPAVVGCGDDLDRPGKQIMAYVEWSTDEKPVPDWCPVRHELCEEKIHWLESQLLCDVTTSDWAKEHLLEIDRLREEIKAYEVYLEDLRNKYGRLSTYWQLVSLDGGYKLATYNFDDLKEHNKNFVRLLKLEGNQGCERTCAECKEQCSQRSFLLPREKKETDNG